jgi:ABC-2 type transport system ATP-binding protein
VLVMDEPTAGLDPIQIRHFRSHVRELGREKTLPVSTHILQEVEAIADRVIVIHKGRLVFNDTAKEFSTHGSIEAFFHELTGQVDRVKEPA